jgi:rod shape-determining protein MreD
MYIKAITYSIFIMLLFSLQISLINGLPEAFHFNLIMASLIIILLIFGKDEAIWCSIGSGFLLDLYSFNSFGTFIVVLPLLVYLANVLLVKFFTNRSLYSFLALILFGTIFYDFFVWISSVLRVAIFNQNFVIGIPDINSIFVSLITNSIFAIASFYAINFISDRLKPVFLIKGKI